jgi:predicted phosphodiesterase
MATNKQTIAGKLGEQLCKEFPSKATLTLAKILYGKYPEHFTSVEAARTLIRYYRGELKRSVAESDKMTPQSTPKSLNAYELPQSHAYKKEAFVLPKSSKKVLLLSDIHIPYQDNEAIEAAVNYGIEQGVDTVYLNGDILDFFGVSFHEKDARKRPRMSEELEMGRQFLDWLRMKFPSEQIYFIPGNHCQRLERYLIVKAPELLGIEEYSLPTLLRLGEKRIHWLEHKSKVYFGKLLVEHGDKMSGSGGINPAKTLLDRFKRSTICGHFHRTSQSNSKVYDGDIQMAWSTGCLCELEPSYMEVNQHNHGAAIIDIFDNGNFRVDNFQIINGKVY